MKILLLGVCPLPFENRNRTVGPGVRTWQFAQPLLKDGHELNLVCFRLRGTYPEDTPPVLKAVREGLTYYAVEEPIFMDRKFAQQVHDSFRPDCIVAATLHASFVAARLKSDKPLWADLFGQVMAEAQAKAAIYDDDYYLHFFWTYEQPALDRADKFSTVSTPQVYALVGELGLRGRLNRHTAGYEFAHCIPCALEPQEYTHTKRVLRGVDVDDDAFVVLWSGGYNTWVDVDTLFQALERAMAQNPHIVFASTGGQIEGHDELTYPRFVEMVRNSPFADRFILRGWIPQEDVPNYYFEGDVGINIDKFLYEGMFGSKNRILDWAKAGLPALTTRLCELSYILERERIGYTFSPGDVEELTRMLLYLADHRAEVKACGRRAREYMFEHFSFEKTTEPLRRWAAEPKRAPDRGRRVELKRVTPPIYVSPRWGPLARYVYAVRTYYEVGGAREVTFRSCKFFFKNIRIFSQKLLVWR